MRELISRYGVYIAGVILVLAIVLGFYLKKAPPSIGQSQKAYFVDEETNEETVQSDQLVPPLVGKAGKATVVRVVKITCNGGKTTEAAFYEKYSDDAQSQLQGLPENDTKRPDLLRDGLMIRLPQAGSNWVKDSSEEGKRIREGVTCPGGGAFQIAYPP